jgi:hypothetical protein
MKKSITLTAALILALSFVCGCDSEGGKIQPLSGQGAPAGGKAGSGPHPMPGAAKGTGN